MVAEPVVSVAWLLDHLGDEKIRIIDATWLHPSTGGSGKAEYEGGHIPGSVHFDIDVIADRHAAFPHMLPAAEHFAEQVGALGIGNDDHVVVYDRAGGGGAAARVWWTFRVFGHDAVSVLDGGLDGWSEGGGGLTTAVPAVPPKAFGARFVPSLVRNRAQLITNIGSKAEQVVDARSAGRFAGAEPEPWPHNKRGHIPESHNLPWGEVVDARTRTLLPVDELKQRFSDAGVALDKPVVATCGSGVTACVLALALYRLGQDSVAVYDGSWAEWGLADDTPVA